MRHIIFSIIMVFNTITTPECLVANLTDVVVCNALGCSVSLSDARVAGLNADTSGSRLTLCVPEQHIHVATELLKSMTKVVKSVTGMVFEGVQCEATIGTLGLPEKLSWRLHRDNDECPRGGIEKRIYLNACANRAIQVRDDLPPCA